MDKRVEIISTVARRRRWTIEEKVAILDEASQPRASITAVADRHGISRNLIYLWRRQAREGSMPGVTVSNGAQSPFVAVRVADSADKAPAQNTPRSPFGWFAWAATLRCGATSTCCAPGSRRGPTSR